MKYRIFFPSSLIRDVLAAEGEHPNPIFAEGLVRRWNVSHTCTGAALPTSGAAIVVANHPTGVLDGVLLNALLHRLRPDLKIVANSLLQAFDPLADVVIAVNPFGKAERENLVPIRQALQWLRKGGMLLLFPAGEVAHWSWTTRAVTEPPWLESAARLAMKATVPVYPVDLSGGNRALFHLAGAIHPRLRTPMLLAELEAKRGCCVQVTVGAPVASELLREFDTAEATRYLRDRTIELAGAGGAFSTEFRTSAIGL